MFYSPSVSKGRHWIIKYFTLSNMQTAKPVKNASTFAYLNFSYVFKGSHQIMKKLHEIKRNEIFFVLFFFYRIRIPTYSVLQSNRIVSLSKPSVFFYSLSTTTGSIFYPSHLWSECRRQRWCFRKLFSSGGLFLGIDSSGRIDSDMKLIPCRNRFFLYQNF